MSIVLHETSTAPYFKYFRNSGLAGPSGRLVLKTPPVVSFSGISWNVEKGSSAAVESGCRDMVFVGPGLLQREVPVKLTPGGQDDNVLGVTVKLIVVLSDDFRSMVAKLKAQNTCSVAS